MTDTNHPDQVRLSVALIATGDELTQGDILNTNGQFIARQLHELGFTVNLHIIVDDEETRICAATQFAARNHDIVILSGGLGPTSDDRTRFALAKALGKQLIFDATSWQAIEVRLVAAKLEVNDANRQQAYFPEHADILANPNGTAAGCHLNINDTHFFMLPGPPKECLPMFTDYVLPILQPLALPQASFKWLLFGASEGEVGALLDNAVAGLDCKTGYRWAYPYLEFKVFAEANELLQQAATRCRPLLENVLVSESAQTYPQQLIKFLQEKKLTLFFKETLLNHVIETHLLSNETRSLFGPEESSISITVKGLEAYWQQAKPPVQTTAIIQINYTGKTVEHKQTIYYRDAQVLDYLVATVCRELLHFCASL